MVPLPLTELIVVAGAAMGVLLLMWLRRGWRRWRRRRTSRDYARAYINEHMTREQIAAAARAQRERAQARQAAAAQTSTGGEATPE